MELNASEQLFDRNHFDDQSVETAFVNASTNGTIQLGDLSKVKI